MTASAKIAGLPALVDEPSSQEGPAVLLTHGAGGDMRGAGLAALARGLVERGHLVVRFDLPYRAAGRRSPPAAEASVEGFRAALEDARERFAPGVVWAVGGKSYGGRVASLAVAEGLAAAGLVFYGYPLHAPGKTKGPRVDHWPAIRVPCLFLQGTRDPFCDLDLLARNIGLLPGGGTTQGVEGGDHSLKVAAGRGPGGRARAESDVLAELAGDVAAWLACLAV